MANERDLKRPEGDPPNLNDPQDDPDSDVETDTEAIIRGEITEDEIDRNLMGSFPASDPPSWTLGVGGIDPPGE